MNNNIELYNLVWNNHYIKSIIFKYLKLYNLFCHSPIVQFDSLIEWENFRLKDYLNDVQFNFPYDLELLPHNINRVLFKNSYTTNVPDFINHFGFLSFNVNYLNSSPPPFLMKSIQEIKSSKFDTLDLTSSFSGSSFPKILKYSIPNSITDLKIIQNYKNKLKKNVLPANLKNLFICGVINYEKNSVPKSITSATLYFPSPSFIGEFSSLVKLSLLMQYSIDDKVKFPDTLQELKIVCDSFNNSNLPKSLRSLSIKMVQFKYKIVYPSFLEYLSISFSKFKYSKQVFNSSSTLPKTLKELKCSTSTLLDSKNGKSILPDNLKSLTFHMIDYDDDDIQSFNRPLEINHLPSTLTYLSFPNQFNQVIQANVLPTSLKTLIFASKYNQPLNPLAIPLNLQILEIYNQNYCHQINLANSHPNTQIICFNIKLYYNPLVQIQTLCLPYSFNDQILALSLKNQSKLQYLNLGNCFNNEINSNGLPANNNIKTLVIGKSFNKIINLEYFQKLEIIIINYRNPYSKYPNITTTINNNNNLYHNNNNNNNIQDGIYDFYSLKTIYIDSLSSKVDFFKYLDPKFYQFVKVFNGSNK